MSDCPFVCTRNYCYRVYINTVAFIALVLAVFMFAVK